MKLWKVLLPLVIASTTALAQQADHDSNAITDLSVKASTSKDSDLIRWNLEQAENLTTAKKGLQLLQNIEAVYFITGPQEFEGYPVLPLEESRQVLNQEIKLITPTMNDQINYDFNLHKIVREMKAISEQSSSALTSVEVRPLPAATLRNKITAWNTYIQCAQNVYLSLSLPSFCFEKLLIQNGL